MEDPTKVQGTTKSKGLRPTQNYIKPTKCPAQIRVKRNTDGSISSSNNLNLSVPTHIKCNVKPKHTHSSPIEIHIQLVVILVLPTNATVKMFVETKSTD